MKASKWVPWVICVTVLAAWAFLVWGFSRWTIGVVSEGTGGNGFAVFAYFIALLVVIWFASGKLGRGTARLMIEVEDALKDREYRRG